MFYFLYIAKELERCKYGENECIGKSVQYLLNNYAKSGLPEIGFPSVDPFLADEIDTADPEVSQGGLPLHVIFKNFWFIKFKSFKS